MNIVVLPTKKMLAFLTEAGIPGFREFFSGNRCYLVPKTNAHLMFPVNPECLTEQVRKSFPWVDEK